MTDTPRRFYLSQIETACVKLGARLTWHSQRWIAEIEGDWGRFVVIAQTFPINNAAAAQIAGDKSAASTLLNAHHVPAVEHRLIRFTAPNAPVELPAVLKPHMDSGGKDVLRARTAAEFTEALAALEARYRAICVSPYLDITGETRVVVLDGEVLLTYRKAPTAGEWRHNLCLGAVPELVEPHERDPQLVDLAQRAMAAIGLRFATVDIVEVDGGLLVLEVNAGVALEHFSRAHPDHPAIAGEIYWKVLQACARA